MLREAASGMSADFLAVEDRALRQILLERTSQRKQEPLAERLRYLSSLGFSWTDLARIFHVSVPALRKWRQGDAASPSNDFRVAEIAALCDYICEDVITIQDVASWLEMPVASGSSVTGIDLLVQKREDLVLRYAREGNGGAVLDELDPGWNLREPSAVRVVAGPDGLPALSLRRQ